jgi:hypothetical protein
MVCLQFVTDACRYVASDLATDVAVHVGEVKFYLHKVSVLLFFAVALMYYNCICLE